MAREAPPPAIVDADVAQAHQSAALRVRAAEAAFLVLDESGITSLDGLEKSPRLETITFTRTPFGKTEAAIDAVVAKISGATRMQFVNGIDIERQPVAAPQPKAKLVAMFGADRLDDAAVLHKADLSGATFEDLVVTQDLAGANLANTLWRRCDIGANLVGANRTAR